VRPHDGAIDPGQRLRGLSAITIIKFRLSAAAPRDVPFEFRSAGGLAARRRAERAREVNAMRVETLMPAASRGLVIIEENTPLQDAAKLLLEADTDLLVACDAQKRVTGVVSKTDLVRQFSHPENEASTAASAAMTRAVVSCRPGELLHDVWKTMKERRLKSIPILDESRRPIGMLNARDLLEALLEEVEHEEFLLKDYVMSIGHPRV
jgi:CBS domain-containing protein